MLARILKTLVIRVKRPRLARQASGLPGTFKSDGGVSARSGFRETTRTEDPLLPQANCLERSKSSLGLTQDTWQFWIQRWGGSVKRSGIGVLPCHHGNGHPGPVMRMGSQRAGSTGQAPWAKRKNGKGSGSPRLEQADRNRARPQPGFSNVWKRGSTVSRCPALLLRTSTHPPHTCAPFHESAAVGCCTPVQKLAPPYPHCHPPHGRPSRARA